MRLLPRCCLPGVLTGLTANGPRQRATGSCPDAAVWTAGQASGTGGPASRVCIVTQTKAALLFVSDLKKYTQMRNKCNKYISLTFTR